MDLRTGGEATAWPKQEPMIGLGSFNPKATRLYYSSAQNPSVLFTSLDFTITVKSNFFILANRRIYFGAFLYLQIHLSPSQFYTSDLNHDGLITAPQMGQVCSQLRAFILAILFASILFLQMFTD